MCILQLSGDTLQQQDWNVEQILAPSKDDLINNILNQDWYERISVQGLTYAEIQELEYYNQ